MNEPTRQEYREMIGFITTHLFTLEGVYYSFWEKGMMLSGSPMGGYRYIDKERIYEIIKEN